MRDVSVKTPDFARPWQIFLNKKVDELATNTFTEIKDKRGAHQLEYHNKAKIYQSEHPELSYKECLRIVYKNNKNDEKII